jgi:hypothetical protein
MEPQDDPEARIRDLERPLSHQANASELGATPYPAQPHPTEQYYPPPPPAGYGAPHVMAAPARKSTAGVATFTAVVVVLVVLGAGALIYFAMRPADGPVAGNPTVAGGGGPLDPAPPQMPVIPNFPTGIPGVPSGLPGMPGSKESIQAGPGVVVNVLGTQGIREVTCSDCIINVAGVANVVTVTGRCASATVSGVNNQIKVEECTTLSAVGFDNRITYKTGSPEITGVTDSNIIEQE